MPAELIRRMLMYVLTPGLALKMSWLGRKKNVEGTHFARIYLVNISLK